MSKNKVLLVRYEPQYLSRGNWFAPWQPVKLPTAKQQIKAWTNPNSASPLLPHETRIVKVTREIL